MMRAIANGEAQHGNRTLEIINYVTFNALVKREYVVIDSRNNPVFTDKGFKAFHTYQEMDMPKRDHPGEVTQFVIDFLGLRRERARKAKTA
jgi:hypothetical protein